MSNDGPDYSGILLYQTWDEIVQTIKDAWTPETAGSMYRPDRPSAGQCSVTSLVLQDIAGGDLVMGWIEDVWHIWLEVEGVDIDITRDQFDNPDAPPLFEKYTDRDTLFSIWPDIETRYEILKRALASTV